MIEVETLGPLARIEPHASVEHREEWSVHRVAVGKSEDEIREKVLPLV